MLPADAPPRLARTQLELNLASAMFCPEVTRLGQTQAWRGLCAPGRNTLPPSSSGHAFFLWAFKRHVVA
eukprot:12934943-Prorocentrum_lima.AAC.1